MNRGAAKTVRALGRLKLSINKAAELVGADPGTFSKILREDGGRKPGRALALRIAEKFGTGLELWDQPIEQDTNSKNPAKPAA